MAGFIITDNPSGTSASVWSTWSSTSTNTEASTWGYWLATEGTSTNTETSTTWHRWVTTETWSTAPIVRTVTPAQLQAHREAQAAREHEAAQKAAEAAEAQAKAEQLLLEHLSPEQERAWQEERAIFVTSQSGKRYKIKEGRAHNFFEVDQEDRPIREFCVHVAPRCPNQDNVLAQKLALEHREAELLRIANVWDLTKPDRPLVQRGQA